MDERIDLGRPGKRPFNGTFSVAVLDLSEEGACNGFCAAERSAQEVEQSPGEFEDVFGRELPFRLQKRRIAFPANFHAAEEIGFRTRHSVQGARREMRAAENLGVGLEAYDRAAAVRRLTQILELARSMTALE